MPPGGQRNQSQNCKRIFPHILSPDPWFSTYFHDFHPQQLAELVNLVRDVPHTDRAMMRRAVRVPIIHKSPRTGAEAITAVRVANLQDRAGHRFALGLWVA